MGFSGRVWLWIVVVLLCAGAAEACADWNDAIEISVIVNSSAAVLPATLGKAEAEADRIFATAGIRIRWLGCDVKLGSENPCRRSPETNEFVVHIVPNGKTSVDSIFGIAFVGQDGIGKYCDVFFDRIRQTVRKSPDALSQLLGAVIAHELGHLLLGSHSHSLVGIMMAHWNQPELRRITMGDLLFSNREGVRMRAGLQRGVTQDIGLEARR